MDRHGASLLARGRLARHVLLAIWVFLTLGGVARPQDASEGILWGYYAADVNSYNSQLFRFYPADGSAVLVGNGQSDTNLQALAIRPSDGAMFALSGDTVFNDGKLWSVDRSTGALTLIGSTGVAGNATEITAADFNPDTGEL